MSDIQPTHPPVPTTKDDLLIAALRHANEASKVLNDLESEAFKVLGARADHPKYDRLFTLLRSRFAEASGVHLFIAATNLNLDLPADLRADEVESEDT